LKKAFTKKGLVEWLKVKDRSSIPSTEKQTKPPQTPKQNKAMPEALGSTPSIPRPKEVIIKKRWRG
jgi:hypothetical protein